MLSAYQYTLYVDDLDKSLNPVAHYFRKGRESRYATVPDTRAFADKKTDFNLMRVNGDLIPLAALKTEEAFQAFLNQRLGNQASVALACSQNEASFVMLALLAGNLPHNDNLKIGYEKNSLGLKEREFNFFLSEDNHVMFSAVAAGFVIMDVETNTVIGHLPGETQELYDLTAGHLVGVGSSNEIVNDIIFGATYSDLDFFTQEKYKKSFLVERVLQRNDSGLSDLSLGYEAVPDSERLFEDASHWPLVFDEIFDARAERSGRYDILWLGKAIRAVAPSLRFERLQAFLGFPRIENPWNIVEYMLGGFVLTPLKNTIKFLVQYPLQVWTSWAKENLYHENGFLREAAVLSYLFVTPINALVSSVLSPIDSFRAAYKKHPLLGMLSAVVSVAAYSVLAIFAAPILIPSALSVLPASVATKLTAATQAFVNLPGINTLYQAVQAVFGELIAAAVSFTALLVAAMPVKTALKNFIGQRFGKKPKDNQFDGVGPYGDHGAEPLNLSNNRVASMLEQQPAGRCHTVVSHRVPEEQKKTPAQQAAAFALTKIMKHVEQDVVALKVEKQEKKDVPKP